MALLRAASTPALRPNDLAEQAAIVRNELYGYLQNPARQRIAAMHFGHGRTYKTDPLGIASVEHITLDSIQNFHARFFTANNTRIVLSGAPETVANLAELVAENAEFDRESVTLPRYIADYGDRKQLPDYHGTAIEIPAGMTE